ncbi:hypothetical protein V5799_006398 [Amblyomma americanum]|uniref:Uncharacterized protein n=1 Tax=Amblyomma americanum TaxID=6943 RepID=A0AAQ4DWI5_AMBAM
MDDWCWQPESFGNLGTAEWKELAIAGDGTFSRCTTRDPPDGGSDARIVRCSTWDFDLGAYGNTIVREFTLVCDRQWLIKLTLVASSAASIVSLPIVIGLSIVIGAAADRVGRKTVVHTSLMPLLLAGVTCSASNSFQFFVTLRLVVSVTAGSMLIVLFVLLFEAATRSRRDLHWTVAMAITSTVVSALFYSLDSLRLSWKGVQLLLMMPAMLMLTNFCMIEESHNWLPVMWKTREAERVAMRAAAANGVSPDELLDDFNRVVAEHAQRVGAVDVSSPHAVISPWFRATTTILAFGRPRTSRAT